MTVTTYEPVSLPAVPSGNVPAWVEILEPAVRLAEVLAATEFVPKPLRGKRDAIAACIMTGAELGVGPMQALASISIIEGRPFISSELLRALVYAAGGEMWVVGSSSDTRVKVAGRRKGSAIETEVEWTLEHAKRAGLTNKPNWRSYPRQMLTARATAELARLLWPDVVRGLVLDVDDEAPTDATAAASSAGSPPEPAAGQAIRRRRRTASPDAPAEVSQPEVPGDGTPQPVPGGTTADDRPHDRRDRPATNAQLTKLNIGLHEITGSTDREVKLGLVAALIGRRVESSLQLTFDEASAAIEYVDGIKAGTVPLPDDWTLPEPAEPDSWPSDDQP